MDPVYTQVKTNESADIESCDDHNRLPSKNEVTKKSPVRHSCLQKCCRVTLIVILVLLALLIGLVVASYLWFSHQVQIWTTTSSPVDNMPKVVVPADELETFKHEIENFGNYLTTGAVDTPFKKPKPLKITERNLNGLADDSEFLEGHSYTHLVPNEVSIDICYPMDDFPGGSGRYLVGKQTVIWDPEKSEIRTKLVLVTSSPEQVFYDAAFYFEEDSGGMSLTTQSAFFAPADWTAPQTFLDEDRNLFGSLSNDEKDWLSRIRKIALKDKKIIIRAEDDMVHHRRLLGEAVDVLSNNAGWKARIARRFVGL